MLNKKKSKFGITTYLEKKKLIWNKEQLNKHNNIRFNSKQVTKI